MNQGDKEYPIEIDLMIIIIFNLGPEYFGRVTSNIYILSEMRFHKVQRIIKWLNWELKDEM